MRLGQQATRLIVAAVLFSATSVAVGNVPPPQEPPPVRRKVLIRQSPDHNYRIVIPQSVLNDLKVAEADTEIDFQPPEETRWHYRSLLAALAMSAGMISLVLVRKRSASTKVLTILILAGATYFAGHAYADLAPPSRRPPSPRPSTKPAPNRPVIQIELTRQRHAVELYVPVVKPQAAHAPPDGVGFGSGIPGEERAPNAGPPTGVGNPNPETRAPASARRK